MKVSVIVPYFNRPQFIGQAIQSIQQQEGVEKEIIIVDDGSTILPPCDVRTYVVRKEHGGCASAKNFGYRHATGDYITTCDDDDMLFGVTSLLDRVKCLEETDADMVYTDAFEIYGDGKEKGVTIYGPATKEGLWVRDCIHAGSMMFRAAAFDWVGYMDEDLLYDEDWAFKIRCLHELDCVYLNKICYTTRYHPGQKTHGEEARKKMKQDQDEMLRRLREFYGAGGTV